MDEKNDISSPIWGRWYKAYFKDDIANKTVFVQHIAYATDRHVGPRRLIQYVAVILPV